MQQIFNDNGLDVQVHSSGSWRMVTLDGLTDNDFAFPASQIAAQNIATHHSGSVIASHQPFFSPMAIATFEPIMELLETAGVASKSPSGQWTVDMAAYLDLVAEDTRWNQLAGAADYYNSPRSVLITSTDIRSSNSAGMYLALASYVSAGNSVISSTAQADTLLPELEHLFTAQGYTGSSSAAPFEDYLSQGMGAVPMVMIYEGQFLEEQLSPTSRIADGMVLAYPAPTIFSTHTGVTFSAEGERVMELLLTDPELARLLAEHGFRPQGTNAAAFATMLEDKGLTDQYGTASSFVNIAQEPTYEVLDYMLTRIGAAYSNTGVPSPAPESGSTEGSTP